MKKEILVLLATFTLLLGSVTGAYMGGSPAIVGILSHNDAIGDTTSANDKVTNNASHNSSSNVNNTSNTTTNMTTDDKIVKDPGNGQENPESENKTSENVTVDGKGVT